MPCSRRFVGLVAFVTAVASSGLAFGQAPRPAVGPGSRVRVTIASELTIRDVAAMAGADPAVPPRLTAERAILTQAADGSRLVLPAPGATFAGVIVAVDDRMVSIENERVSPFLSIPRMAIAKLERVDGRRSRARYAGFGALIGAAGGALAGAAQTCRPNEFLCSAALNAFAGGILGAGGGAAAGAIIPPAERWTAVEPDSLSSSASPQPSPVRSPPMRRATITLQTGLAAGGPAHDVEDAMRASGFADTAPGFFGPAVDHPFSRTGFWDAGRAWTFEVNYRVNSSWSVAFVESRTPIGETLGYRSQGLQFLTVQYRVATTTVVALRSYEFFRGGAGVAWQRAQTRLDPGVRDEGWSSTSSVGMTALAGVRLPRETPVFLDVSLQYRYLPAATMGPFAALPLIGSAATIQPFDAKFSHWLISFGPGVRF